MAGHKLREKYVCVFTGSLAVVPTVYDVIARTSEDAPPLLRDAIARQDFSKHGDCPVDLFHLVVQRSSFCFLLLVTARLPSQFLLFG